MKRIMLVGLVTAVALLAQSLSTGLVPVWLNGRYVGVTFQQLADVIAPLLPQAQAKRVTRRQVDIVAVVNQRAYQVQDAATWATAADVGVYVNGLRQRGADFTVAKNGSTLVVNLATVVQIEAGFVVALDYPVEVATTARVLEPAPVLAYTNPVPGRPPAIGSIHDIQPTYPK